MRKSGKLPLYWRTLRHLKTIQVANRIKRNLFPPRPDLSPVPPLRASRKKTFHGCRSRAEVSGNRFTFMHCTAEIRTSADWNREDCTELWLIHLHSFDFLRNEEADGAHWIDRWIKENPPGSGIGWKPYPLSRRIVNWVKHHRSGRPLSPKALNSLAVQLRFLSSSLEYHLLAYHLLVNAKALIFGGSLFDGEEATKWLKNGWAIYREQLPEQVLADGGHFERSLMYHSLLLEDLLDVYQETGGEFLRTHLPKMFHFLRSFTGPDGQIALFNDAAFNIATQPAELMEYAERLDIRPEGPEGSWWFGHSGYLRMEHGDWTLFADAAPVGPDYQPGHAHADTLGFELFFKTRRIAVDSGVSGYQTPRRIPERSTGAHNTLRLDERDSSEVWAQHRVGRRARITGVGEIPDGFTAEHDGYRPVIHRRGWRRLELVSGSGIEVEDELKGSGAHKVEMFWHFHPDCEVKLQEPGRVAVGEDLLLIYPANRLTAELSDDFWSPEFGLTIPNRTLRLRYQGLLPVKLSVTISEK